jgi:signal transduction histidine kinase
VTLLREQDIQGQEAQKLLGVIREQTDRLERLVGDLVTLSHLDEGELKVRRERFDLRRHLRRIAEEVAPRAEERGIRLDWEVRGEGEVFLDPDRLDQILLNLLDNALRYSRRGGQVRVTGIIDREKNRVRIDVADEGIGIPKEELKRIWDRFYRVEKSRARRFGGSGLGLSIVKQLTDLLGGSVEVHSEPGKGTTFVLTFPLNGPEGEKKGSR